MKIPLEKKWILIEREDYANYLFVVINWEGYTVLPRQWKILGVGYTAAEYINSACNLYVLKDDIDKANAYNFKSLFTNPNAWDNLHKINKNNSNKLFSLSKQIRRLKPQKLSNKELVKWIDCFQKGQMNVHIPRGPMWLLETPDNLITNYLHNYLIEKKKKKVTYEPQEAFQILTSPLKKSNWTIEREELAKIAKTKNKAERERRLKRHVKKFEWLEYGLQGKILDLAYFKKELEKILNKGADKILDQIRREITDISKKQKIILKEYSIHNTHLKIFRIIQDSLYVRLYSKDSQFFGYYCMENIFREVGKRAGLTLEQVRFLAPVDFKKVLMDKKDFSDITNQRQKYSLHFAHDRKTFFYLGHKAKQVRKKLKIYKAKIDKKSFEIIKGQTAYNGKTKGRAKIINTVQEMVKMHPGNILVSHMTNPGIVPVMKQAAAIITDLGGITSHAAIVARELKKPCIIGTKIATKVLKDGDLVEVDATKGMVKKLTV